MRVICLLVPVAADEDREDRTSLALVQQRMFEEQQVILKRQVFMQSHICLHAYVRLYMPKCTVQLNGQICMQVLIC